MSIISYLIIFINDILSLQILGVEIIYILITILSLSIIFGIIYAIAGIDK